LIKVRSRQRMLDQDGFAVAKEGKSTFRYLGISDRVLCPFCLFEAQRYEFAARRKNGRLKGKARCPECRLDMYTSSVVSEMTLEEFAKWIVDYPYALYWRRANFDALMNRLWRFGGKTRFWDAYHKAKSQVGTQR
jgi:hypothetical protein